MKRLLQFAYYISFGWLLLIVAAEVGALLVPGTYLFTAFLSKFFFTWLTAFAVVFVVVRFIIIAIKELKKRT